MNQPHPDDTWLSRYGIKVRILSLPRNKEVYYEILEGPVKEGRFQKTREEFLRDFVKVEET